jgi:cation diffusion facilitator family transporter
VPHQGPEKWTLAVLGIIILWKEFSYRFVSKRSDETHSTSLKADAWHHRSDALTSIAAFIGILIAVVLGDGYEAADDWAALVAVGFILYNCYLIFRPALGEIMDEHLYDDLIDDIHEVSRTVDGIIGIEKCFIRKAGMVYHLDIHAIVDADISVKKGHDLSHKLQDALRQEIPGLGSVLIHIEPNLSDVKVK